LPSKWGWICLDHETDCPIFWGYIDYDEKTMSRQYLDDLGTMRLLDSHPYVIATVSA